VALLNPTQLKRLARTALDLFLLVSIFGCSTRGQEPKLIVAPVPKLEALAAPEAPLASLSTTFAPEPHFLPASPSTLGARKGGRLRLALDRPAIALGLLEGGSELFDGVTTKHFLHHCSTCIERDPVSRSLLGSRPTWAGMIAAGSVEAFAAIYLNQGMRRSPHKFVRRCASLVPLLLTGIHLVEGAHNLSLKNNFYCVNPAYVLTPDNHCALPSSAPAGSASLPGRSGNRASTPLPRWK
jgi:hypothetical protein